MCGQVNLERGGGGLLRGACPAAAVISGCGVWDVQCLEEHSGTVLLPFPSKENYMGMFRTSFLG